MLSVAVCTILRGVRNYIDRCTIGGGTVTAEDEENVLQMGRHILVPSILLLDVCSLLSSFVR